MDAVVATLSRWIHVLCAALAVGGAFFAWVVLPAALSTLDEARRATALARCRRTFKVVSHTALLLLVLTGIYNAFRNTPAYAQGKPLSHAMLGLHVLLALGAFGALIAWLAEPHVPEDGPPPSTPASRRWLAVALGLFVLAIGAASSLKWVREHPSSSAGHNGVAEAQLAVPR